MSPEYKVFVPDAGSEDFVSSVKQIEGAKILSVDKNSNEVLALKTKGVLAALPKDTSLYFLRKWKDDRNSPVLWRNFVQDLAQRDRAQLIRFIGLTLQTFLARDNYVRQQLTEGRGEIPVYKWKLDDMVTLRLKDVRDEVFAENIGQFPIVGIESLNLSEETGKFIKTAFSIDEEVSA